MAAGTAAGACASSTALGLVCARSPPRVRVCRFLPWAIFACSLSFFVRVCVLLVRCVSLHAGEKLASSESLQRACKFVLSKQQADGGWGETFESCTSWEYQQNKHSQVVGTAWALLTLLFAEYPDRAPLQRGVEFLMRRQLPDGNWKQEDISGVFNATCSISYSGYKNIFSIWALGLFAKQFPGAPAIAARL